MSQNYTNPNQDPNDIYRQFLIHQMGVPGGPPMGAGEQNGIPGAAGQAAEPGGFSGPAASTSKTTEPLKVESDPAGANAAAKTATGNNVDTFMKMLNDSQYKGPQDAIDAFNKLGLSADGTGLSSNYGSSPAFYDKNGGQIGLPDRYLTKQPDGTWAVTMRGSSGDTNKQPSDGPGVGMGVAPIQTGAQKDDGTVLSRILQALSGFIGQQGIPMGSASGAPGGSIGQG